MLNVVQKSLVDNTFVSVSVFISPQSKILSNTEKITVKCARFKTNSYYHISFHLMKTDLILSLHNSYTVFLIWTDGEMDLRLESLWLIPPCLTTG